ncbi:uncharacterized protein [Diadema setosum]|uniref:uncharacterized protein isoform X1 n=1 Tax=Diadema setosum TaxID=31175 RepID=UPI003B3B4EDC
MPVNAKNKLSKTRGQPSHGSSNKLFSMRETLASSDGDLNHDDKGIHASASNPNLAAQGGDCDLDPTIGRVSRWAVDFERLLTDELGLCCFTEFLKKEFSEENIMFWIACEKMAKITDRGELQKTAQEIYDKHLAPKALMPVNLDSGARALVEEAIKNPTPEMFKTQQQQIFKLMKFDSYARFLKSKLYQDCVLAEMASLPLPISLEKTDGKPAAAAAGEEGVNAGGSNLVVLGEGSGSGERNGRAMSGPVKERMDRKKSDKKGDKKKPSFSEKDEENGDKKKTSILPWRNKQKKPKDGDKPTSSSGNEETSVSSRHSSVTSSDFRPAGGKYVDMNHCFHMIFPNNEILTLTPEPDQNLGQVLMPLLEERGLGLQNVEIFLNDTKESDTVKQKLVDMDQMATSLIGRQIIVERRVLFKIELPNKRVIGVKSKLSKKIIEVLRPVAYKYKLHLDAMVVHLSDSPVPLDLDFTVASLDGQRILIETLKTYSGSYDIGGRASVGPSTSGTQQGGDEISHTRAASVDSFLRDEDPKTSSVQTEMLKAKLTATMSMQPPGDTRRDQRNLSAATAASPATKVGTLTTAPAPASPTATPAAEPALTNGRTEGRRKGNLKIMDKDTEDLIAMVSKAQNKRLDDQRGLTLRNLELPDFLKVPSTSLSSTNPIDNRPKSSLGLPYGTQPLESSGKNHQHKELTAADIEALKLRPKSTPPRPNAVVNGGAVFSDGILPTHSQAEELFGGSNPRNPVVRFNDTVVSSTYRDTSWDDTSTANYSQKPDMVPLSMTPDSYQLGSYPANKADKLSPRAYGHSLSDGNDSTDHGHNNTAYSLEFNSSYGSGDQPSLNATLTSSPSESKLQLPPVPDLDSTLQETMANYTPPPSLNNKQESPSRDIGPTRQTPIIHPFSAGSTLPGHTPDLLSKPILDSGSYASNGYSRSISAAQLSCSNNNNTFLPSSKSVPDIQTETNNCYSNYCPIPTTPDGSFYGSSPTVEAPPKAQPDVSQMYSRALRPPPSYHSSRGAGIGRTISAPSMNSMSALPSGTQPAGRQGSQHGEFWSRVTSSGTDAQTTPGLHGSCKQIPYKKVGGHPTWSHPSAGGARPRVSSSGTIGGASGACSGSSTGAQGYTMPASGGAYQKSVASGDTNFQGKETVIISKDGRKLRATFV